MNKLAGLLEKELRQHAGTFSLIFAIGAAAILLSLSGHALTPALGGGLNLVSFVLTVFVPLSCYALAGSMICGEFRHRTQIFLEGLPLPNWQLLSIKFGLGLSGMLVLACGMVIAAWWRDRHAEVMTTNFLCLLGAKAGFWAAFAWAFNFAAAFLGRYRLFAVLAVLIGCGFFQAQGVQVGEWPPFSLLGPNFAFERFVWPVGALAWTAIMILALTMLAFRLGTFRDTSIAALLAEKMSIREHVVIILLALTSLFVFGHMIEASNQASASIHLPGAVEFEKGVVRVQAAAAVARPTDEEQQALARWTDTLGPWLVETARWLGCEHLPTLYLVHRPDYKEGQFEWEDMHSNQGTLVRINLCCNSTEDHEIREQVIHHLLDTLHHGRLQDRGDERGWVLDGFVSWWVQRCEAAPGEGREVPRLVPADLAKWMKVREEFGEEGARAAAAKAIALLGTKSEAGLQAFLSQVLSRQPPANSGAVIRDLMHPIPALLHRHLGLEWEPFAREWLLLLSPSTSTDTRPASKP